MNTYSLALASFAIISAAALPTASNPLNQFVSNTRFLQSIAYLMPYLGPTPGIHRDKLFEHDLDR